MTPFTESPYEKMMSDPAREAPEQPKPPPPESPCYGCGNWYGPCIWPCYRQMGYDKFPKQT